MRTHTHTPYLGEEHPLTIIYELIWYENHGTSVWLKAKSSSISTSVVVGSISKSRVSWKFQTTPLQIWFTGPVESIFLGKHHFYQPTYAVKWDLKICINLQNSINDHGFIGILAAKRSLLSGFPAKCPFHWWLSGPNWCTYIIHWMLWLWLHHFNLLHSNGSLIFPALWWSSGRYLIRSGRSQLVLGSGMSSPPFRPPG